MITKDNIEDIFTSKVNTRDKRLAIKKLEHNKGIADKTINLLLKKIWW